MKLYEVEVVMTVHRTLRVWAPTPDTARQMAGATIEMAQAGHGELSSVLKWTDDRVAFRPTPVETIVGYQVSEGEPVEVEVTDG